jgi:Mce-associated membrane protein
MAVDAAAPELSESPGAADDASKGGAPPRGGDRPALVLGLVIVVTLSVLVGWLGLRAHQVQQAQKQRELFLQAGRQTALNLTTIDFQHANADLRRILDCATGQLYDNFSERAQPYVDVVLRTQSKSVGTVTEAAVESFSGDKAQVLVAVTVTTSNAVAPQPERHAWRMRLSVRQVGGVAKASNVEFVP